MPTVTLTSAHITDTLSFAIPAGSYRSATFQVNWSVTWSPTGGGAHGALPADTFTDTLFGNVGPASDDLSGSASGTATFTADGWSINRLSGQNLIDTTAIDGTWAASISSTWTIEIEMIELLALPFTVAKVWSADLFEGTIYLAWVDADAKLRTAQYRRLWAGYVTPTEGWGDVVIHETFAKPEVNLGVSPYGQCVIEYKKTNADNGAIGGEIWRSRFTFDGGVNWSTPVLHNTAGTNIGKAGTIRMPDGAWGSRRCQEQVLGYAGEYAPHTTPNVRTFDRFYDGAVYKSVVPNARLNDFTGLTEIVAHGGQLGFLPGVCPNFPLDISNGDDFTHWVSNIPLNANNTEVNQNSGSHATYYNAGSYDTRPLPMVRLKSGAIVALVFHFLQTGNLSTYGGKWHLQKQEATEEKLILSTASPSGSLTFASLAKDIQWQRFQFDWNLWVWNMKEPMLETEAVTIEAGTTGYLHFTIPTLTPRSVTGVDVINWYLQLTATVNGQVDTLTVAIGVPGVGFDGNTPELTYPLTATQLKSLRGVATAIDNADICAFVAANPGSPYPLSVAVPADVCDSLTITSAFLYLYDANSTNSGDALEITSHGTAHTYSLTPLANYRPSPTNFGYSEMFTLTNSTVPVLGVPTRFLEDILGDIVAAANTDTPYQLDITFVPAGGRTATLEINGFHPHYSQDLGYENVTFQDGAIVRDGHYPTRPLLRLDAFRIGENAVSLAPYADWNVWRSFDSGQTWEMRRVSVPGLGNLTALQRSNNTTSGGGAPMPQYPDLVTDGVRVYAVWVENGVPTFIMSEDAGSTWKIPGATMDMGGPGTHLPSEFPDQSPNQFPDQP